MNFRPTPKPVQLSRVAAGALSALLLCVAPLSAPAQYQVYQWLNFEDGKIPDSAIKIAKNPAERVHVVNLAEIQGMPAGFRNPQSAKETGQFALKLKALPVPKDYETANTGLAASDVLDRDKLGEKGRALYQADFYIPAEGEELPSIAVLAMEPPENAVDGTVSNVQKSFYRFGLTLGKTVYFSLIRAKEPAIFEQDPEFLKQIPRGGWHRFALVMEGKDTIRCYVDGREPKFSPIHDASLRKLVVGVMVAEPKRTYDVFVDNLSIQVSEDAPILPHSPYNEGWGAAAADSSGQSAADGQGTTPPPSLATLTRAGWLEPLAAWERARQEKKPLLLYFYAPGIPGTVKIDEIFASNPAAADFIRRHAAARVDINQLQGGSIAKQYDIYRVPTLLVISPDAKSYRRAVLGSGDSWETLAPQLTLR